MLHSIKFKNFFSFKDEGVLDLQINKNAPETDKYFYNKTNKRLNKVLSVFGYNASGKTNALKAISFFQWFIISAYTEKPDSEIPIMPFVFTENKNTPTEMTVEFSLGNDDYLFYTKLTAKKIFSEKLQKKSKNNKKYKTLFERIWEEDEGGYIWKDNFSLGKGFKDRLRQNASVLATAIRDNHKESLTIFDFWKNVSTNISVFGKINNEEPRNVFVAAKFFDDNPKLKKVADDLLEKFDLGLKAMDINKKEEDGNTTFNLSGVHYDDYKLSFHFLSSGTRSFFAHLKNILQALNTGGVAVLDEFDSDLHPMMCEEILDMFYSEETNPKNAQLIFSAHNPHLLNFLDKYQIVLTEKNKKGESDIWRLDEMRGVRSDDNYYAKYIMGAYGAVPDIEK